MVNENRNTMPTVVEDDINTNDDVNLEDNSDISSYDDIVGLTDSVDFKNIFNNNSITFNNYYDADSLLFKNPLLLDNKWKETALHYLPHDTGIEIECSVQPSYSHDIFNNIPFLVANHSDTSEQRVRIPQGLEGFQCLYNICETLKTHCLYSSSGIHYHIDMRHIYKDIVNQDFMKNTETFIIKELESWQYKGTYNSKQLGGWYRFQSGFETIELRVGEMTFDYRTMCKRICHGHYIVKILQKMHSNLDELIFIKQLESLAISDKTINFASSLIRNRRIFV